MAISLSTPVGALREQLLPVLASWIHGDGVGVECLHASLDAIQVTCKSRTLVVHPQRCDLLMLMLGSELLANRRQLRNAAEAASPDTVRNWLRDARARLVARFPAFANIPESTWQPARPIPCCPWFAGKMPKSIRPECGP